VIGLEIKIEDNVKRVEEAAERATFRNVGHGAATLRSEAIESIIPAEGPSEEGTPPHTHTAGVTRKGKVRRGELQRAIVYDVDRAAQSALIGPRESVVGESGAAHEFGGEFKGQDYPERSFMGSALDNNDDRLAESFAGSIGE
jgi:hypothetical protein